MLQHVRIIAGRPILRRLSIRGVDKLAIGGLDLCYRLRSAVVRKS